MQKNSQETTALLKQAPKQQQETAKTLQKPIHDPPKAFHFMGIPFYSKKVIVEFVVVSLLVVVVPVVMTFALSGYVNRLKTTETMKTVMKAVPPVLWINIVIGVYIYRVIKDPVNYLKLRNQPLIKKTN